MYIDYIGIYLCVILYNLGYWRHGMLQVKALDLGQLLGGCLTAHPFFLLISVLCFLVVVLKLLYLTANKSDFFQKLV